MPHSDLPSVWLWVYELSDVGGTHDLIATKST